MMIPVIVRHDLESEVTLKSLTESPYVHLKHSHLNFLNDLIILFFRTIISEQQNTIF